MLSNVQFGTQYFIVYSVSHWGFCLKANTCFDEQFATQFCNLDCCLQLVIKAMLSITLIFLLIKARECFDEQFTTQYYTGNSVFH